ncbi:MAG TPA: endolytic transglycosylase MltG [Solirubrobacterales bacterium]|nr:endolytic transglycosylase MltG [Solirubrobacterales bacterium]
MADDWLGGDPFADPADPAAAEREQRRREREQRRREREEKRGTQEAVAPPPPPPPPAPPTTTEESFWDEEPADVSPAAPQSSGGRRDRGWMVIAIVVGVVLAGAAAAAVAVYRYLDNDPPPSVPLKTITLTVPEGYSRAQTAALAREAGLRGDYEKASQGHEGFLFPDTFELEKRAPVSDLVQLQLQDFKRRTAALDLSYARSKNLTLHDVVTIASMVEEEAQLDSERRLIAAVVYNRLREGIPLGIDATVRFATSNYEQPLTESELAVDSPYNTRLNAGLPPGPISSPGLASIEAAARPAQVDYLYYVVEPGTCGKHAFSSTDAEFQADVARYNEAREAAGGESPDSCGE